MPRVFLDLRIGRGGVWRYGSMLAAALPQVAAVDVRTPSVSAGLSRYARMPFTPWGRASACRAAAAWDADLVHGLHLEVPACRMVTVVTIQDLIPLQHPGAMQSRLRRHVYRRILDASLSRAAKVIVPSESTAAALDRYGADRSRVVVIPLGVSSSFRPSSPEQRVWARRRFAGGQRYVAASTGSKIHKNLHGLAKAADIIRRRTGLAVLSTGEAPPASPAALLFVGWLQDDQLRAFYGGAEAVVVASHVEGFGLPALEALGCGTPAVCGTGLGALPYLRGGVVAVDVRRPGEIADAVELVISDESVRRSLVDAGLAAARVLSAEAMARATVRVYKEVLGVA